MAQNSTTVALPQLVDLALNCPEMGTLNFTVLHTLLHVLIQQVDRSHVAVEFRGADSDRIQTLVKTTKPAPVLNLTEYAVVGDKLKKRKSKEKKSLTDLKSKDKVEDKEKEIRVIERRKNSKEDPMLDPPPLKSPPGSAHSFKTIVVVEPPGKDSEVPHFTVAVTKSHFDQLEKEVEKVKEQLTELTELPANMGLIEATRGEKASPILDMFQILNLTKRLDAAETGMEKMATLVEDLAKEGGSSKGMLDKATDLRASMDAGQGVGKVKSFERRLTELEEAVNEIAQGGRTPRRSKTQRTRKSHDSVKSRDTYKEGDDKYSEKGMESPAAEGEESAAKTDLTGIDLSKLPPLQAMTIIQKELENLHDLISNKDITQFMKDVEALKEQMNSDSADLPPQIKINQLESRFNECIDQINNLNMLYHSQLGGLQGQFGQLEKELTDLLQRINSLLPGGDATGVNEQSTLDLYNNFVQLQGELNTIAETATKLMEDKEEQQRHMEAMLEQIDLLKIVKANREDLEDALGDKADACMINRKVSHDQFDAACDDLSKGIEDAMLKLTQQEEMWQQALDDIQKEIGNKLDKMEVDPLKNFVNSKLKSLHEKFKTLTALKREQEAAGTKSKYLRNVNCISCDKDVVMRKEMDPSLKPQPYALPPTKNMAPYLAYELDQLRKQQKCIPNSKNLNYFENAIKGGKASKDKDHICNRYCGGSHTVTTPQQRVTRLGHFLEQWGPEVAPVNDEYIRGNDNHMYKARDESLMKRASSKDPGSVANVQNRASMIVQGDILTSRYKKVSDDASDTKAGAKKPENEQKILISTEAEEILAEKGKTLPPKTSDDAILQKASSDSANKAAVNKSSINSQTAAKRVSLDSKGNEKTATEYIQSFKRPSSQTSQGSKTGHIAFEENQNEPEEQT